MTIPGRPSGRQVPVAPLQHGGDVPLVDLLDRLLEKGAGISGDVLLSIAGVDLVWLGLRAVIQGIDDREGCHWKTRPGVRDVPAGRTPDGARAGATGSQDAVQSPSSPEAVQSPGSPSAGQSHGAPGSAPARPQFPHPEAAAAPRCPGHRRPSPGQRARAPERFAIEGDDVERGLAQLVLTVVELIRQLLERQALRRVENGALSHDQVERLGVALMRLSERMGDLKEQFGLSDDEVRLRLSAVDLD